MSIGSALIIDDEFDICELLSITLNRMNIETKTAHDLKEAKLLLKTCTFNICLTDMRLPDGDGLSLLEHLQLLLIPLPVIVITAHGNTKLAVKAMKLGAFDFLSKPIDLKALRQVVNHGLKTQQNAVKKVDSTYKLLGDSAVIQAIHTKIAKIARSQVPVYIKGESGVGKELVARLIHEQSARGKKAFIPVNCGAIPHELMESEFFGHQKGSFTGAIQDKKGLFLAAEGGTLFLDEVADLPLLLQVKLLRALQEKKIRPVGASAELSIDVRVLSATHQDLNQLVQAETFRQDLYYRINVIELEVLPLRKRADDIPQLCTHFLNQIALNNQMNVAVLSVNALTRLKQYHFPGNVRELGNILERAVALYEGEYIEVEDLNLSEVSLPNTHYNSKSLASLDEFLNDIEKNVIIEVLEKNNWHHDATAQALEISLRSLHYRLKKTGIE